jgi:hypothetical protein
LQLCILIFMILVATEVLILEPFIIGEMSILCRSSDEEIVIVTVSNIS